MQKIDFDNLKNELADAQRTLNDLRESSREAQQAAQKKAENELLSLRLTNIKLEEKIYLKSINKVNDARVSAENRMLQLKLENLELEKELQIQNLNSYEEAANKARNDRLKKEIELNRTIAEKQFEAGVSPNSKLGKLIAAQEQKKAAPKVNIFDEGGLLGKNSTATERILAASALFSGARDLPELLKIKKDLKQTEPIKQAQSNGALREYRKAMAALEKDGWQSPELFDKADQALQALQKQSGISQKAADEFIDVQKDTTSAILTGFGAVTSVLGGLYDKLSDTADQIALNKSLIDGRLQGAEASFKSISSDVSSTMLDGSVRSEKLAQNIYAAVNKGIARDVSAMGAIDTIKDRVAPTFETFNSTVLRLIKIQNQNTSYARLGMEASLNKLFNELYSTSEYLSDLASSVRGNLEEAQALMGGNAAVNFEFQVQKWLGSLSSAGMSSSGVSSISSALGKIAAGQIEGLTEGGAGNLLIMAANNANLSIADILADGLDASETNILLNSMVGYMQELVSEANGNKVVQQQLAKVFGLSASDLRTAINLASVYKTQETLAGRNDIYENFLYAAGNSGGTVTLAERLSNMWANTKYSIATQIASSPALYTIGTIANVLDDLVGGIQLPAVTAFGTGIDLKTSVSNIMKSTALVGATVKTLTAAIKGGSFGAAQTLAARGAGTGIKISSGSMTSESGSGTIYNGSVEDFEGSATAEANDKSKKLTVKAQEEADEVSNKTINENIVGIYNIIKNVVNGEDVLHVRMGGGSAAMEAMKVEVVNYDQFAADRYSWSTQTNTLTDTWTNTTITNWTNPAVS